MKIVKGLMKGRIGSTNTKRTTSKIHAVSENNPGRTLCGIDYVTSSTLGYAEEGQANHVNCTKCKGKLTR